MEKADGAGLEGVERTLAGDLGSSTRSVTAGKLLSKVAAHASIVLGTGLVVPGVWVAEVLSTRDSA